MTEARRDWRCTRARHRDCVLWRTGRVRVVVRATNPKRSVLTGNGRKGRAKFSEEEVPGRNPRVRGSRVIRLGFGPPRNFAGRTATSAETVEPPDTGWEEVRGRRTSRRDLAGEFHDRDVRGCGHGVFRKDGTGVWKDREAPRDDRNCSRVFVVSVDEGRPGRVTGDRRSPSRTPYPTRVDTRGVGTRVVRTRGSWFWGEGGF